MTHDTAEQVFETPAKEMFVIVDVDQFGVYYDLDKVKAEAAKVILEDDGAVYIARVILRAEQSSEVVFTEVK
jgi:hypothetical protein